MEEVIIKEPICEVKTVGYRDEIQYKANDGTIFPTKLRAEDHEKRVVYKEKIDKIKHFKTTYEYFDVYTWYFPANEEEFELVKNEIGFYEKDFDKTFNGELKINEWMGSCISDHGDSFGYDCDIYTLTHIKEEFNKFLKEFEGEKNVQI